MASLIKQTKAVLAKLIAKPDLAWAVGQALINDKLIVGPWEFEDKRFARMTLRGVIVGWVTTDRSFYNWYVVRGAKSDKGSTPNLRDALQKVDTALQEDNRIMASSEIKLVGDWYQHKSTWERRDLVDNIVLAEINKHYHLKGNVGVGEYEVTFHEDVGAVCIVGDFDHLREYADQQLKRAGWTLTEEVGLG